jgi:2-polyprenyl-3-methyl-5-hydroxy-6-metoxy-1,4-benzoquinol methylase
MATREMDGISELVADAAPVRSTPRQHARAVAPIIRAYDSLIVRAYCVLRFRIIRGRFLEEIRQFLPREGTVFEVGCGFGLFGLYFARACPGLRVRGIDVDEGRIALADKARRRLGVANASFEVGDARSVELPHGLDGCYMLDLLHHVPRPVAEALISQVHARLRPGGVFVVKDVDTRPRYKMAFTWLLDVLMTRGERPRYWSATDLTDALEREGFGVIRYAMVDLLPYPHQLYVCVKPR